MEYKATAKYVRSGTRKVRLVADAIRKLTAVKAVAALRILPKDAAEPVRKVIESAIANAKQKQANEDTLVIKSIEVMGGPVLKRWHAASRGMAHPYKKRMSHVTVVLSDERK